MSEFPSILLEKAVSQMASLPGIGRRTALRLVLHILRQNDQEVENFADSFVRLKHEVIYCSKCHNISDTSICPICASFKRDQTTICVVENVQDIISIENTGQYTGLYHVLGGIISPMDGVGPKDIQIDSLIERAKKENIKEIILALPTTMEGDTTNFYIYRRLQNAALLEKIKMSQIARGVAVGNQLEYTDEITLGRSIINRTDFKG